MMNTIDWLRSACDPAVVLDIGYKTSPYEFLIGLCVWRTGQLLPFPECLLSLLALPPPLCPRADDAILQGRIIGSE